MSTTITPTEPMVGGDDDVRKAARGLEAHFLRQMLTEVSETTSSAGPDAGFAGSTFKEMLDGALADAMAKAGGIGLGKVIEKELERAPATVHGAPLKISP